MKNNTTVRQGSIRNPVERSRERHLSYTVTRVKSYFWDDFPCAMYRPCSSSARLFNNNPGSSGPSQTVAGLRKSPGMVSRFYEWMDVTTLASGLGLCRIREVVELSDKVVGDRSGEMKVGTQKRTRLPATIFSTAAPVKPALNRW